jgi:hypothetical protein
VVIAATTRDQYVPQAQAAALTRYAAETATLGDLYRAGEYTREQARDGYTLAFMEVAAELARLELFAAGVSAGRTLGGGGPHE